MSYEQFFGLSDAPFSLAPNPRYLFESASHAHALQELAYAIGRREPLVVVTGEIGSGKTLLCRTMLQRLDRHTFVSVINNPLLERDDLLKQMLQDFGVISTDRTVVQETTRHDLVHALEDFLASLIPLDAHAAVMIDEAQHIQPDVLEQIRLLSNIDAPSGTRLQIMLVGPLELESLLERPELRQFQQRVSRRIRLEPLGENELRSYIEHRLAVGRAAGSGLPGAAELAQALAEWNGDGTRVTFTPEAVQAVWRASGGLPRLVNLLCDRALETAYHRQLRTIDADLIEKAETDRLPRATSPSVPSLSSPPPLASPPSPPSPDASMWPHLERVTETVPVPLELASPSTARSKAVAGVIGVVALAAGVAWFVFRTPAPVHPDSRATPTGGQPAAAAPATQPPPAAPSDAPAAVPAAIAPPPASAPPEPTAAASEPAARSAGGSSFEIVVASFRTESRADAVAAQVTDAGLAVRRRVIGGWQQVIAGPFPSRDQADAARQRLERAGLPGTQIVASTP
jgi:general secretion pathway protein A